MNKDNAKDYLPLVQALTEGKTIQMYHEKLGWGDVKTDLYLDSSADMYRIKPEPRELWVKFEHNDIFLRDTEMEGYTLMREVIE